MRFASMPVAASILFILSVPLAAQSVAPDAAAVRSAPSYRYAWAEKTPMPWIKPNRPHWKLSEILAMHAGQKHWDQPVVRDSAYSADYIQMAPGEKTKPTFFAQTDVFWIVEAGQMRVNIEGQEPFLAKKGFVVWAPYRLTFTIETVGDEPSLRFQAHRANAPPLYTTEGVPPPGYVKVAYAGEPGKYPDGVKPYVDFNTDIVANGGHNLRFLPDGNFLRGEGVPTPADSDRGHFHTDHNEFWFIMEGQMTYKIEGVPLFTASQGDVVYAPRGRFHRPSFAGSGMATRLSIAPAVNMANLDPDNPSH